MSDPYQKALNDLEDLLDNAVQNGGGIDYGSLFIPHAHLDYEIRDQINELRELRHREIDT